jgi:hypothetical protein
MALASAANVLLTVRPGTPPDSSNLAGRLPTPLCANGSGTAGSWNAGLTPNAT